MENWLQLSQPLPLSTPTVLFNLAIGSLLGGAIGWHFIRFGRTLGNRAALGRILVILVLATILVISIVKASLALSLGLVGALSIVRFRTPIKEPEELAYLFLAIAAGLGLGADQRIPTILSVGAILVIMAVHSVLSGRKRRPNLYLNIELPTNGDGTTLMPRIARTVANHVETANVRRMDVGDHLIQATFFVDCRDDSQLFEAMGELQNSFPSASVSFIDQTQGLQG